MILVPGARTAALLRLALLASCAAHAQTPAAPPAMAPLWTVHVDEVRPERVAEFERLNAAENRGIHAMLRRYGQPVRPVYEIATVGAVYMSFRPRNAFADLDAPSAVPDSVARLFPTVTDSLDVPIHAALKQHHNEIWRFDRGDSYFPATPGYRRSTPGYVQLISERVIPRMADRYGALLDTLKHALRKANHPWGILVFTSSYGDGAYRYLWQADSKEEFLRAGDRAAVLTAAYGKRAALGLLADWRTCLAGSEVVDAAPRRAYTDLDSSEVWLGLARR